MRKKLIFTLITILGFNICGVGQEINKYVIPRTNSRATLSQTVASTQIEINYNRPNKKGREIFGGLVPYDKVWRTGSDEATKIYFSTPVLLEGVNIDSGRYELFTVPGKETWEVILQQDNKQWGSYSYRKENDVMRFFVESRVSSETIETFTIEVLNVKSNSGVIQLLWGNVIVPIIVTIDLSTTVIPQLEEALQQEGRRPYFQAAMFYYENDLDINRAEELMKLALESNPGHIGMLYRYALILKEQGDVDGAILAAEQSYKGAQQVGPELKAEYSKLNTSLLAQLKNQKP